jgi:hypothetical protein
MKLQGHNRSGSWARTRAQISCPQGTVTDETRVATESAARPRICAFWKAATWQRCGSTNCSSSIGRCELGQPARHSKKEWLGGGAAHHLDRVDIEGLSFVLLSVSQLIDRRLSY